MPVASSPSTSRRLLALLSLLQARRDWPAPALARRLEVSERTVRRDIDRLRELDYAIDATRGPDGGYRLQAGSQLPPLLFDDEQAVALALALRTAGSLGVDIEESAARALLTVSRLMPSRLAHRIEGLEAATSIGRPGREPAVPADVLLRIGRAIRDREELRFDYTSPGAPPHADEAAARRTEPHHLLLNSGRWYVVGFSAEKDDWRVYRADRMDLRSHTGRRFERRTVPGGDAARFLAGRFAGNPAGDLWALWGSAVLHARLADVLPYIGDGSVEEIAPGRCRVRIGSWSWGSLASALTRWEADISEAEPAELRAAFAALAVRAAAVID